jgi:transposase
MSKIFIGLDVSKGYCNAYICNESGSVLYEGKWDDTFDGHQSARELISAINAKHTPSIILAGAESTGGYERNWARLLKTIGLSHPLRVYVLNPYSVKRFMDQEIHRGGNDRSSARYIARYLLHNSSPVESYQDDSLEGAKTLYRCIRKLGQENARLKTNLLTLLSYCNPELVRFCRNEMPRWMLHLLKVYPTAKLLASADASKLASIPFIGMNRANEIQSAACNSVASQVDDLTGEAVSLLSSEILERSEKINRYKNMLIDRLKADENVRIISSIPGIGGWSAVCLRLEIGSVERFPNAGSLVAYSGLDPNNRQSGDVFIRGIISRRGRKEIRAILFPLVFSALRCNPVIFSFYHRLRSRGKNHKVVMVACMNKLLHIIFACLASGKKFDIARAGYSLDNQKNHIKKAEKNTIKKIVITAPVSRQESKKRAADAETQDTLSMKHAVTAQPRNILSQKKDPVNRSSRRNVPQRSEERSILDEQLV